MLTGINENELDRPSPSLLKDKQTKSYNNDIDNNKTNNIPLKLQNRNSNISNSTANKKNYNNIPIASDKLSKSNTFTKERSEFIMANRVKNSEVINNELSFNPLKAPFALIDSSTSLTGELSLLPRVLQNMLHFRGHQVEDTGLREHENTEKMKQLEEKINKLQRIDSNSSLPTLLKLKLKDKIQNGTEKASMENNENDKVIESQEDKILFDVIYDNAPISLPKRDQTWKHQCGDNVAHNMASDTNLKTTLTKIYPDIGLESYNENCIKDPQTVLDEKNQKKTSFVVDSFLLGYADMLCLTSSFLKDETGFQKGPLLIPLLSICITDITQELMFKRIKYLQEKSNLSTTNIEDLLRKSVFDKNRLFRLHLEYGAGDHVIRWDLEKNTKDLMVLHKKLSKRNPKERLEIIKKKDAEIPKFPVLPSHFAKLKGLFKNDKEFLVFGDKKTLESKKKLHEFDNKLKSTTNTNANANVNTENNINDITNPSKPVSNKPDHNNNDQNIPAPLERQNSISSLSINGSDHSITRTLTRLSTVALNSLMHKDHSKDTEKENISNVKEKLKHQLLFEERLLLNQKYRDDMQKYLDTLLQNVSFKDQAGRLLQFLELSPFSLLLSNEIYRKRKEGYLYIVSSTNKQGWRVGHFRIQDIGEMIKRHTSKWCVLGDSFLMYTSNITSTTPQEIFLIDHKTQIKIKFIGQAKQIESADFLNEEDFGNANDNNFDINDDEDEDDDEDDDMVVPNSVLKKPKSYSTIKITNSERTIQLVAKSPKATKVWVSAIKNIMYETEWAKPHRFNSFAPVRHNAFAQWFVDARDYWYAASSAIEMAKDVIYIHDWWLSPELYLRRPANGNQNWRIDRLLKRKAEQGVKIFIIIYRNVGNTVVTDSMYTKHSLLSLHDNIYVMRSPNQIMQNVFFWAHHEKLLVIDHSICFLGGIDLCFGRYDTPDHVLVDDNDYAFKSNEIENAKVLSPEGGSPKSYIDSSKTTDTNLTSSNTNNSKERTESMDTTEPESKIDNSFQGQFQVFPGKDYSNPRKKDFFDLPQPHSDMYDRKYVPRMPWHDVHMVTGGQIARDLSRHFIQRWNYLLRQKRPSRPTPVLIPPRPFTDDELKKLNFKGSCEIQLLRSSCDWSLGLKEHEQSIQNAYIKCIEQSEHFVYIENQFFVTSCTIDNCVVKNHIGDALVDRIIRAHRDEETWKAVIVIPLMPGFEANVDSKEGGSVRLIMKCQYMSISMGDTSIFARLRRVGIKPEDYIQFYSLRKWGLINHNRFLTTEQLYIHAKTMIVDDRIAIIGSANINERSMRGTRDSEVCAIVRDKDMIESKMDGEVYHVGKFSHNLRVRLMREHLGIDVDLLELVERRFSEIEKFCEKRGSNASILKSNIGKKSLSAMVELGTRYLLGLNEGTPCFKQKFQDRPEKYKKYGELLTKEMLTNFTTINNECDDSNALDDIEFSFSFNHRAGAENMGIRSNKAFSSDNRVENQEHKREVKGGYDGYNSRYYKNAKFQINKFLNERVNQCAISLDKEEKKNDLLPDFESIIEILSQDDTEDANYEQQNLLNVDRWTMIKRLYYMRKLYSKLENNDKRNNISTGSGSEYFDTNDMKSRRNTTSNRASPTVSNPENDKVKATTDIPLVSLTDDQISDIDKNMLPQIDFEFLDPYGFEDPLDIGFFEGTWMTQAIRNTLLFQLVFHVQPDDNVQTWRDYKGFDDLQRAFETYEKIYQDGQTSEAFEKNIRGKSTTYDDLNSINNVSGSAISDNYSFNNDEDRIARQRRRLERSSRLAELDRYQRNTQISAFAAPGFAGYGRGTVYDHETSLKLMKMVRGHVVLFPTRWLVKEVEGDNWFYKADKLPPIQIYN